MLKYMQLLLAFDETPNSAKRANVGTMPKHKEQMLFQREEKTNTKISLLRLLWNFYSSLMVISGSGLT